MAQRRGLRHDRTELGGDEMDFVKQRTVVDGIEAPQLAREVNERFHAGLPVRSLNSIRMMRTKFGWLMGRPNAPTAPAPQKEQEVTRKETEDGIDLLAIGRRIKTVDDLVKHAGIDLARYEIHQPEATSWDVTLTDPQTGKAKTIQNHRVHVKARLKAGPDLKEQVEAILAGAFAPRKPLAQKVTRSGDSDILQAVPIPDAHLGDLAWGEGTGGPNNDTAIGVATLRSGVNYLMARGDERGIGQRHFWILGDYFQHDGRGMTTKGTPLDYDSRVQKMLRDGSEVLFDLIAASAEKVPTRVILVPGNHDSVLTWALQRILVSEFRKHKGVTVDDSSTTTKYLTHGKCLIGLDHGDKGKKRLPEVMAAQCAVEWGRTTCRHIHTGHLHGKAKVVTEGGVVVWTHDSLKPADQWHTDEKFNTSPRTIEAYRYHAGGMFDGSDAWSPDLHSAPKRGTV
jgi:hypothetical protein